MPNMPEVVTVDDDVRSSGQSGLSADLEFPAESDPFRNSWVTTRCRSGPEDSPEAANGGQLPIGSGMFTPSLLS